MSKVLVEFNNVGQARFTIDTESDEQIFTALLGIEAYLADKTGLHINDIRAITDDLKKEVDIKPDEIVDVEIEDEKETIMES